MKRAILALCLLTVCAVYASVPGYRLSLREMGHEKDWAIEEKDGGFASAEGSFSGQVSKGQNGFGERFDFSITSTLGKDRGLIARFEFPVPREGKSWCGTIGREQPITGTTGRYSNSYTYNPRHFLADGKDISGKKSSLSFVYVQSETFIGSVYDSEKGLAIAVPRDLYCMFNLFYDNEAEALVIEYYFGLTSAEFRHDSAAFRFYVAEYDARGYGFRAILQRYYDTFPLYTHKRYDKNGSMMAFIYPGDVNNHDELGLATVWGNRSAASVRGLKYTVPGQLFFNNPNKEATDEELLASIEQKFAGKGAVESICRNAEGRPVILKTFYADHLGTVNNDPAFPYGRAFLAEVKESLAKEAQQYGGIAYDGLLGGMNFNRDHFAATRFALLYNPASEKCFINNYFSCLELARHVHDATSSPLKVISANVTKPDLLFGAPFVDVTTGEPAPRVSYEDLAALRQACGKKTVALLTKHCYVLDRDGMERYFRHCLALGVFPGYFDGGVSALNSGSSYFSNSRWLEPMRPLWRKYMGLVKELASEGWEPCPKARVEEAPGAVVERFGNRFYTVRNPGNAAPKAELRLTSFAGNVVIDEMTGRRLEAAVHTKTPISSSGELVVKLPLGMDDVRVISVNTEESLRERAIEKALRILEARGVTRKYEAVRGGRLDAWKGTYELVRTGGHTGAQCISSGKSGLNANQKSFYLTGAPKEVKIGVWAKAEDLKGALTCVVYVHEHNRPSRFTTPQRIVFPAGTYDWQYKSVTVKTENNFGGIMLTMTKSGSGKVFVDDVEYIVDGENIATDPSFEGFVPEESFLKECDSLYATLEGELREPAKNVVPGAADGLSQLVSDALFAMPYTREYRDMEEIFGALVTAGLAKPPVSLELDVPKAADFGAKLSGRLTVVNRYEHDIALDKVTVRVGDKVVPLTGAPSIGKGKKEVYGYRFEMPHGDVSVDAGCLGAFASAKVLGSPIEVSVLNVETQANGKLRANLEVTSRLNFPVFVTARFGWRNGTSLEKKIRVLGSTKSFVELEKPQAEQGHFTLLVSVEYAEFQAACSYVYRLGQLNAEAVATVDSSYGGYEAKALNDGIIYGDADMDWRERAWASTEAPGEHWAALTFSRAVGKKLVIYWHKEDGNEYVSREFDVQAMGEDGKWSTIQSVRDNKEEVVAVEIPRPAKAYRVLQLPGGGSASRRNLMWVTEIEIY